MIISLAFVFLAVSTPADFTANIPWGCEYQKIPERTSTPGVNLLRPGVQWLPRYPNGKALYGEVRPQDPVYVSAAELAFWRSPRGLDYRIRAGKITLWPYDHSGSVTVNLKTGRCTAASGCMAGLVGQTARVGQFALPDNPMFDRMGSDVLLPVEKLQGYLGAWGSYSKESKQLTLRYYPAATAGIGTFGEFSASVGPHRPDKVREYVGKFRTKSGLSISIILDRGETTRTPSVVRDEIFTSVANHTRHSILFQAFRLAPVYHDSLPCIFSERQDTFPKQDLKNFVLHSHITGFGADVGAEDGIIGPSSTIQPQSIVDRGNVGLEGGGLTYWTRTLTVGDQVLDEAKTIRFRYSDGHGSEFFNVRFTKWTSD